MHSPRSSWESNTMTNNNRKQKRAVARAQSAQVSKAVQPPAAMGSMIQPSKFSITTVSEGVVRLRGHEMLGVVSVPSPGGSPIAGVFDLNPACWTNSRLARIASTYEKYRYDRIRIRYHPSVATSTNGSISCYLELEADENVALTPVQSLNHQYSFLGPAWAPGEVTYVRPAQDPTTYYLTNKGSAERTDLTQGKAVFVAGSSAEASFGYAIIEYDVVFMYPELESGYSGEQYQASWGAVPIQGAGDPVVATPAWASVGVKVAEVVLNRPLTGVFQSAAGNTYDLPVGSLLYTAWDGVNWLLYQTLSGALATTSPLRWVAANAAAFNLGYQVRKLVQ